MMRQIAGYFPRDVSVCRTYVVSAGQVIKRLGNRFLGIACKAPAGVSDAVLLCKA